MKYSVQKVTYRSGGDDGGGHQDWGDHERCQHPGQAVPGIPQRSDQHVHTGRHGGQTAAP